MDIEERIIFLSDQNDILEIILWHLAIDVQIRCTSLSADTS